MAVGLRCRRLRMKVVRMSLKVVVKAMLEGVDVVVEGEAVMVKVDLTRVALVVVMVPTIQIPNRFPVICATKRSNSPVDCIDTKSQTIANRHHDGFARFLGASWSISRSQT